LTPGFGVDYTPKPNPYSAHYKPLKGQSLNNHFLSRFFRLPRFKAERRVGNAVGGLFSRVGTGKQVRLLPRPL
jgi:hypothetical protein